MGKYCCDLGEVAIKLFLQKCVNVVKVSMKGKNCKNLLTVLTSSQTALDFNLCLKSLFSSCFSLSDIEFVITNCDTVTYCHYHMIDVFLYGETHYHALVSANMCLSYYITLVTFT